MVNHSTPKVEQKDKVQTGNMNSDSIRDMLFISHASEDNDFTSWLALQLAKEGYGVWCDLTKLLGGENWPKEINQALQIRTQKFLFALSKYSNQKHDPQGELTTAFNIMKKEGIENFIVPLKVDDLEHTKTDYRLQNIQSISFKESWSEGLGQLLRMLERDNIKKHKSFTPNAVNLWWRNYKSTHNAINNTPETLFSNRYQILSHPPSIYAHHVVTIPHVKDFIPHIFVPFKQYLISLTESERLCQCFESLKVVKTEKINISTLLDGTSNLVENNEQGQYLIARIFNQTLWKGLKIKGLLSFSLASKKICFYFHEGLLPHGTVIYTNNKTLSPRIKLWGETLDEKWHWAIRGWFESMPLWHYTIQFHILVSDKTGEVRPAPKRVYFRWNNRTWGERLRASMLHLAGDSERIILSLDDDQGICIDKNPLNFISPVTFIEPQPEYISGSEDE